MDTIKFAQCMKQNMEFKGLTTETLGALTGIPITRLKEYESGELLLFDSTFDLDFEKEAIV